MGTLRRLFFPERGTRKTTPPRSTKIHVLLLFRFFPLTGFLSCCLLEAAACSSFTLCASEHEGMRVVVVVVVGFTHSPLAFWQRIHTVP